jgi:hypothetical protein
MHGTMNLKLSLVWSQGCCWIDDVRHWIFENENMFRRYLCTELWGKDKDVNVNCGIKLKVFIALSVKITVFWNMSPCALVMVYRRFRKNYCLPHQGVRLMQRIPLYLRYQVTRYRTQNIAAFTDFWHCKYASGANRGCLLFYTDSLTKVGVIGVLFLSRTVTP